MKSLKKHTVLITGTGPGNPDLLTVLAHQAISNADLIVFDCMPARFVLDIKRPDAEVIYVCKNHDAPDIDLQSHDQNIIDLLEKGYHEGKKVVRLKSGDAFMYGSGGLEANLLKFRNIPFEIIPGLTAGAAAANLYGIHISEKNETDMVIYYIAFHISDQFYQIRQIANMLKIGATLVLYMADNNLANIIEVLKEEGIPETMPAIVVGMASLPDEECAVATLDTIQSETVKKEMLMPYTYFIGTNVKASVESRTKMVDEQLAVMMSAC